METFPLVVVLFRKVLVGTDSKQGISLDMTFLSECKALRTTTIISTANRAMNKPLYFIIVLLLAAFVTTDATAQNHWNGAPAAKNRFQVNYRALFRENTQDDTAVVTDGPLGATLLRQDEVTNLGTGGGMDIAWVFDGNNGYNYELRGNFATWEQETSVQGAGFNLASTFAAGIRFNDTNSIYDSEWYGLELNQRRDIQGGLTLLAGIRYMQLNETLEFSGNGLVPVAGVGLVPITASTTLTADNPMIGLQAGFEGNYALVQGINFQIMGKGGVYSNSAETETLTQTSLTADTGFRGQNSTMTFMGEMSLRLHYDLILNMMSLYAGYDLIYLDNVALAPEQAPLGAGIEDDGQFFTNGISFGISLKR